MAEVKVNESLALAVGAEINLLGFDMGAMLTVANGKVKALVMPGMSVGPQVVSLKEMLKRIGDTFDTTIPTDGLDSALGYVGLESEKTMVRLNQAFALYDNSDANTAPLEYAFSISIINDVDNAGQTGMFTIKSLSFSIWNTARRSVIQSMNLGSIEDKLAQLETLSANNVPVITAS